MDITKFIEEFIDLFIKLMVKFFELLSGIEFYGTNLFEFMISMFLMGAAFTVIVASARNGAAKVGKVVYDASHSRNTNKESSNDS